MVRLSVLPSLFLMSIVAAQPNPFRLPKSNLKAKVTYQMSGDQKGTAETAYDGDRMMTTST